MPFFVLFVYVRVMEPRWLPCCFFLCQISFSAFCFYWINKEQHSGKRSTNCCVMFIPPRMKLASSIQGLVWSTCSVRKPPILTYCSRINDTHQNMIGDFEEGESIQIVWLLLSWKLFTAHSAEKYIFAQKTRAKNAGQKSHDESIFFN